ncbi:hypothetical protein I3J09_11700 [Streptomyces clavuligerus]|uniref:Uncharacterized protein n=4 Tax=Streptomyces clavuligerus TaxID=1901 RepID=E2Q075_STRCL|nr:hypothetical protein [Streptomyces clavuligerus]ANW18819.1 hypothetical protein BB341_11565 [Streptomyces clavuligerus]AXU13389.1 hypothetical protein D1794_11965 [Streptomyces clavuligerus]EFG08494.1 Hypothetical protein SCLAV_3423 [Streptomyces clavuligerus]QCS06172.1 hypothetical protein CRV15_11395 [Streptomyces clavuligerus]QPJ94468.1 hypothetical protein GE265_16565 [Streptomyces clavuligerus]
MTHSGQGEDRRPAARPAHEGVIIPSDGSTPFTAPEAEGDWWAAPAEAAPEAPAQPWAQGPESVSATGHGVRAQPLPPARPPYPPGPYGASDVFDEPQAVPPVGAGPLPPQDPEAPGGGAGHVPWAPEAPDAGSGAWPVPPVPGTGSRRRRGASGGGREFPPLGAGTVPASAPWASGGPDGADATQVIPPVAGAAGDPTRAIRPPGPGPGPGTGRRRRPGPAGDRAPGVPDDATQVIPPVGAQTPWASASDATQVIPPVGAGPLPPQTAAAGDPTQVIPPVRATGAGALPPERPAQDPATRIMPPVPAGPSVPPPPTGAPYGIRPGAPGDHSAPADDRGTPAEFDNLFRGSAAAAPRPPQPPAAPPSRRAPGAGSGSRRRARPARERRPVGVPVIAAVVVGCAVLGLGVGAALFGGGGGGDKDKSPGGDRSAVSPSAPGPDGPAGAAPDRTPAQDSARPQARELDRLLADSNDSRAAVIRSVENIKRCTALPQAAADLRGAAEQRRGLVTRLDGLTVDRLPGHRELTRSLAAAWEASAEADDHYAAWADQAARPKGCKKDKARPTGRTARGNAASGRATEAKKEASERWNPIAARYGLTARGGDQL